MRIVAVDGYQVQVPVRGLDAGGIAPYVGSQDHHGVSHAQSLLVAVRTDEGITGWGEMNTGFGAGVDEALVHRWLAPALVGADPLRPRDAVARLHQPYWPHLGRGSLASAAEMALWDILGRSLGVPVSTLLGGRRQDTVPLAFCLGITDVPRAVDTARRVQAEGWSALKMKIGRDMHQDLVRVAAVAEATDGLLLLRLDANQGYTRSAALQLTRNLEGMPIEYIEQPLVVGDVDGMRRLTSTSPVPMAINEDAYLLGGVARAIATKSADAAVVDLEAAGGVAGLLDLAGAAMEHRFPLAHHCGWDLGVKSSVMLQVVATHPAFTMASDSTYVTHLDDVVENRLEVANGQMTVPTGSGIGVTVDEEAVRRLRP